MGPDKALPLNNRGRFYEHDVTDVGILIVKLSSTVNARELHCLNRVLHRECENNLEVCLPSYLEVIIAPKENFYDVLGPEF